jgi:hypothetical protein
MSRGEARLRAGFGKVDVTPPLAIPYLSFYPRQTPFEGVHDRLYARAMAVELVEGHPSPPGPLSTVWRGGTHKGVPDLKG